MNGIFTRMTSAMVAFLIASAFTAPALADEPAAGFADVAASSPYYEAVNYFAKEKIVAGTKDEFFHLDEAMTRKEWTTIMEKIMPENHTSTSESADALTPAFVYASIWQAAGIKTYSARDYGFASDLDAGTSSMLSTGLIDKDDAAQTSISRGEALRLLYEVAVKKSVTEVPSNLVAFFDVSTDCEAPEETEKLLRKQLEAYPNNQLALLLAYGYNFEIWDDLSSLPVENSYALLGLEDDGKHTIYLEKEAVSQWALHEVGHAVETCNCSYSKSIALNKAEREAGIALLGQYAGVNSNEFIAEATSYFMKNQGNEAAMQAMQESMPQTYAHLSALIAAKPFLSETYFLDIVSH